MRPFLILLTILVFTADTVVFLRFRSNMNLLANHPEEPLSPAEERRLQSQLKLLSILSAAGSLLLLILIFL